NEVHRAVVQLEKAGRLLLCITQNVDGLHRLAGSSDESRNLGTAFYETDMLEDAEREFRRVIQEEPHDLGARHFLARIALRRGDAFDAVRRLVALLESGGPRVDVYLNLAYALRLQGRHSDALQAIADAGKLAPDDPRIALAEGATRLAAGQLEEAAAALDRDRDGIGDDGAPPAPYYHAAALAAAAAGRLADAADHVERGLGQHPASAPLHLLAGNIAERKGDMVAAEAAYRRAAEEDPTLPQAHRNLGDVAEWSGRPDEALEHYRRAAELDPDLGDVLYSRMAGLHYRRREREEAIRCWRRAIELNPRNEVARSHLEVVTDAGR
ncbi:MAG: tetratricopeptide repeat protein, partial [Gemmatimonadota bacterium]